MPADSLRTKLFLALGGTIVGVGMGFAGAKIVKHFSPAMPAGAQFESVDDLRRAMLQRGDEDVKADDNVSLRTIIAPDPSDLIIYRLRPGVDTKFMGVNVKTNSFGMRGPETTLEKPPGTYRIALLGDSFAFGWGVEQDKMFAKVAEDTLNSKLTNEPKVEILNFGTPGYSTFQETALFREEGLRYKPDAVLVYFVENDFGLPFFIKHFGNDDALVMNDKFSDVRSDKSDEDAQQRSSDLLRRLDANRSLKSLAEFCKDNNIPVFLIVNPNRKWQKVQTRLRDTRKGTDIHFLSIRGEIERAVTERHLEANDLKLPNDPHPNALKHGILGEAIAAKLLPFITERKQISEISRKQ